MGLNKNKRRKHDSSFSFILSSPLYNITINAINYLSYC